MRAEGPDGAWTARIASPLFDGPPATSWTGAGLLGVKYGFWVYALDAGSGELRWTRTSGTPMHSGLLRALDPASGLALD